MKREEAERALEIVRSVIQQTRDDLVERNWGGIWIVHAFTNAAAIASIGPAIESRGLGLPWYFAPLAALAAVNGLVIRLLGRRDQGVRSYLEFQLHGVWTTFIVFSIAAGAVLHLAGAPPPLFGPIFALLSGVGFSLMGVIFYGRFVAYAVLFVAVAIASRWVGSWQWPMLGGVWWAALFVPGVYMHRELVRRRRGPAPTRIL